MLRRLFAPFVTQPPIVLAYALLLFVIYGCWSVLLLASAFSLDDHLTRADLRPLAFVAAVVAPLLAGAGTWAALRTLFPAPDKTEQRFTSGARALLAYNGVTTLTVGGMLTLTLTGIDAHKLLAPVVLVVVIVNAVLLGAWGRRAVDLWTAWGALLLAGALTVGAAALGLRAPLDIQVTVDDVPLTFAAPEGRLLDTCRPVTWDAGVPKEWDAFVRVGFDGGTLHRTLDIGTVMACPYTASDTPGNPERVVLVLPLADGETRVHQEVLTLKMVGVRELRLLVGLALATVLLPPLVVLVWGGFAPAPVE